MNDRGVVRVIVELTAPESVVASAGRAAALASVQEGVLDRLTSAEDIDLQSVKKFKIFPGMALAVDAVSLQQLLDDPAVAAVHEDVPEPPALYDSIPLIDADLAWNAGYRGAGQAVVILDTGVDKNHPFLRGKVVSEACYSTNTADSSSLCPGGQSPSTAANSGLDCPLSIVGCGHGTHVAGIAAGRNGSSSDGTIDGVATDAWVIAIKVFSQFSAAYCRSIGYSGSCVLSWVSDQMWALERVEDLLDTWEIAAVNISINGQRYFGPCDADERKVSIDVLRRFGVATVISSGNDGAPTSISVPGCISSAITVGATTKDDVESEFSNAAHWLDLLAPGSAPGSGICSSVIGSPNCGGSGSSGYGFKYGTSMAAPHVTGAWAVLKSMNGTASVSAVEAALENTGVPVSVGPVGNKPRIDLDSAIGALSLGVNKGLNWDHCQQTYRAIGDSATWCYLESLRINHQALAQSIGNELLRRKSFG